MAVILRVVEGDGLKGGSHGIPERPTTKSVTHNLILVTLKGGNEGLH